MNNATPDFVQVQLSPSGLKLAGSDPLKVSNGRRSFTFNGSASVKVELSYEWKAFLSKMRAHDGSAFFMLAPASTPTAPTAAVPQATPDATKLSSASTANASASTPTVAK